LSDPSLLKKHSGFENIVVKSTGFHYPEIRVYFSPHVQRAKLPNLPLLVFIHGLGGSVAQFHPLLTSLSNIAPCLAVDLPGCGRSKFSPTYWSAYETNALVLLLVEIIERYREQGQDIVLVCHSMGSSLGALLSSTTSPFYPRLGMHVLGLIAICPPGKDMKLDQANSLRWILSLVIDPIFDLWRAWDRRGGIESASIARFTGPNADVQLKRLQMRFNNQSRTPVFRRMAYGALPKAKIPDRYTNGAFVGESIWSGIKSPVLIIAGKDDPITSASEAIAIAKYIGHSGEPDSHHVEEAGEIGPLLNRAHQRHCASRLIIFPSPASHALLYSPLLVHPVSNLIQHWLASGITEKLSLGWQLQYLTTEGKWDVKNLVKWQAVEPVSAPIAGIFRALKTLREVDDLHNPKVFVSNWSPGPDEMGVGLDGEGSVVAVVDISHDPPVYDPAGLEQGGIIYRKCPSVSKLPPTLDEVRIFIDVVDQLRTQIDAEREVSNKENMKKPLIAVHCHYGFNRTGFFVIAYLVEKLGWPLQDAIDEFERCRPPGVRHTHFVDTLWGRYWNWADEREKS
jgi:pimeloyl-ACP methyl ester carboxylesterase/protein-tyrosine phosphatase